MTIKNETKSNSEFCIFHIAFLILLFSYFLINIRDQL